MEEDWESYVAIWTSLDICMYCERIMKEQPKRGKAPLTRTKDHIIPKSLGGDLSRYNKLHCCYACNHNKGNLTLKEWREKLLVSDFPDKELIISNIERIAHCSNIFYKPLLNTP